MATESPGPARTDGRRTRHAQRRPELLGRAADFLLEHGLPDVSLRPLAEAMGVSHRTVLHHFASKQGLLIEAVQEIRRREQDRLRTGPQAADAPIDRALSDVWRRFSAPEHLPYVRLHFELQSAAQRQPDLFGRFLDELVGTWIDLIAERLAERGVTGDEARALATFVYATMRGLQLDLLATADRARVDSAFGELARALDQRLTASPATSS